MKKSHTDRAHLPKSHTARYVHFAWSRFVAWPSRQLPVCSFCELNSHLQYSRQGIVTVTWMLARDAGTQWCRNCPGQCDLRRMGRVPAIQGSGLSMAVCLGACDLVFPHELLTSVSSRACGHDSSGARVERLGQNVFQSSGLSFSTTGLLQGMQ